MRIELRNIQIQDRQSEETTAFTASLYIENFKVGYAKNSGKGGCTDYGLDNYHDEKAKALLKEAEEYCSGLEPVDLTEFHGIEAGGERVTIPMDMENYIDQLVDEYWKAREDKKFKAKLKINMEKGLVISKEKNQYSLVTWKKVPIANLLKHPSGPLTLKTAIKKYKKEGYTILNTNIPEELL
jgi:hypothetical protein